MNFDYWLILMSIFYFFIGGLIGYGILPRIYNEFLSFNFFSILRSVFVLLFCWILWPIILTLWVIDTFIQLFNPERK